MKNTLTEYEEEPSAGRLGLTKMAGMENLSLENLAGEIEDQEEEEEEEEAAQNRVCVCVGEC